MMAGIQPAGTADPPSRARVRGTARRVAWAFTAVLALFAAAMLAAIWTQDRLSRAMDEMAALDHAKHAGHYAAAHIREQYMHQAHVIIRWSRDHVPHYEAAVARMRRSVDELASFARSADERRLVAELGARAADSDALFRAAILPALDRGDRAAVHALHDELERIVAEVVELGAALNDSFEARSAAARAAADALQRRSRWIVIACIALAIALSAAVSLHVVRSIAGPIAALRRGAERIGTGDLRATIDVAGDDEFGELAAAFNQMSSDLARNQDQLVRSQRLASIGRLAAGVAHEINNPLGVILGYVKLLQREDALRDREELAILEEEARQCQRIVQSLLELSRTPRLQRGEVDLGALARDAVARLDEAGALAGVDARVTEPPAPVVVEADEARLRQVVTNLVVNAAEATPAGGAVVITVRERDGGGELVVTDTGAGIDADTRAHLFEPFFTTKPSGTGLGLAIAHGIVDAHGGRLAVESEPDRGTEVTLWLPKEPAFS